MSDNTLNGADAFLSLLEDEGVRHLFGNPGTTELPIMAVLGHHPGLRYVLGLQEGAALAMADGYARASGRLSACNVHVAPGLGNAMGALYNAKWSGSPVLVTAGQHEQGHGLTEPLLYEPLVEMAAPLVKWATEVNRLEDLPRILRRAAKVALTAPTGPVFVSLPGDVLKASAGIDLGRAARVATAARPADDALLALARELLSCEDIAIVAGDEVARSEALGVVAELAELLGAAVYQQTVPHGAHYPSEHVAFMGGLSRDQRQVRETLARYRLLLLLGGDVLQMSVAGTVEPVPDDVRVVHIGSADWNIAKNRAVDAAFRCDVKETVAALLPVLREECSAERAAAARARLEERAAQNWSAQRTRLREAVLARPPVTPIDPELLMLRIAECIPDEVVVVDEGLVSSRSLLGFLPFTDAQRFYGLASGGIGFAMPGAIGIQLAAPERPVLAIVGDGSALYTIQALWSAAHLNVPVTYVIANNGGYRILRERLTAWTGSVDYTGMELDSPAIDFVGLATSLGVRAERIEHPDAIVPAVTRAIDSRAPALLDVHVARG